MSCCPYADMCTAYGECTQGCSLLREFSAAVVVVSSLPAGVTAAGFNAGGGAGNGAAARGVLVDDECTGVD